MLAISGGRRGQGFKVQSLIFKASRGAFWTASGLGFWVEAKIRGSSAASPTSKTDARMRALESIVQFSCLEP